MSWTRSLLQSKLKALAIHLGISALIFIPLLALIWFVWFPPPFFFTDGGWQGVRLMLIVDMVIGPALTFLVWNPAKSQRALTVDYTFICFVQAAALTYGYVSVESKRVMAVAYQDGAFTAVTQDRFQEQEFDRADWARLGEGPPYWAYVRKPDEGDEATGAAIFSFSAGIAPHELFFLYDPLPAHAGQLRASAQPDSYGLRYFRLNGYFRTAELGLNEQLQLVTTRYPDVSKD